MAKFSTVKTDVQDTVIHGDDLAINSVTATGSLQSFVVQGGGWDTIDANPNVRRTAGATVPTWTQMDGSSFWAYKMAINDILWFTFRLPHGYSPGTDVYFNVHWTYDQPSVNIVKWNVDYMYAKGYGRGVFNMTSITASLSGTPSGVAWTHMTSEDGLPISNTLFEADGYIQTQFSRVTNAATEYTGSMFILGATLEYQTKEIGSKNREYPYR